MANCISDIISNISAINNCGIGLPGIKKVFLTEYTSNIFSQLTIFNGQIIGLSDSIKFSELDFDSTVSFYSEKRNFDNLTYDLTLTLQLLVYDPDKRSAIDALVKSKLVFLIQNYNDKWFMFGEKLGATCFDYNSTTSFRKDKTQYNFTFLSEIGYLPFSVDPSIISFITNVDCSALDQWRFENSIDLYWYKYRNCIVNGII